jgi:GTP cyclohydrolase I
MDKDKLQQHCSEVLKLLGENPEREGLKETPRRYADAMATLFGGYDKNPEDIMTVFDDEKYDEMIVVKEIEFYSTCEHHMLPFWGKAHIGYIPNGKIVGLSKIPRIVDIFARRLQNQERLTQQVAQSLKDMLDPKGVGVVIEAQHMCMMARGVQKQGSSVSTSAMIGLFKEKDNTRSEFLKLIS